jgi:hypothetical protein
MGEPALPSLPFVTRDMIKPGNRQSWGLRLKYLSNYADGELFIRGATRSGPFSYKVDTNDTSTLTTHNFKIPDIPIWISVDMATPGTTGRVFVQLALTVNDDLIHSLVSGFVWNLHTLTWPASDLRPAQPNLGYPTSLSGNNPAAGAQISYTHASGTILKLESIYFTLAADANAANRRVHVNIYNANAILAECISATDHTASTTRKYLCFPTTPGGSYADDDHIIIPIPRDIYLFPEDFIVTTITNGQAGDDFGIPKITGRFFYTQ